MKNLTFAHLINFFLIILLFLMVSISCKNNESMNSENTLNTNNQSGKAAKNFNKKNLAQLQKEARQLGGEFNKELIFEVSYNKFNDGTSVGFNPFVKDLFILKGHTRANLSFDVSFTFSGNELKSPADKYSFSILSSADEWKFLRSTKLIFLIDGTRFEVGDGERRTSILGSGTVVEHLYYEISKTDLERIADAKSVELQVGIEQVKMTKNQQYLIKNFIVLLS